MTITWAGISAYLSVFYTMLFFRRRSERDVLSFAFIAFSLFIHSIGTVLLYRARTLDEGTTAECVAITGVGLGVGLLVDFVDHTCGIPNGIWRKSAYAYSVIGVLGSIAGLLTERDGDLAARSWGFASAPDFPMRDLSVFGWILAALAFVFVGHVCVTLIRFVPTSRQARAVLVCAVFACVAGINDFLLLAAHLRTWPLVPHAGFLVGGIMSASLIDRFVRSRDELQVKTSELVASYDRVKQASEELQHKQQLASVGELSAVIAHEVRNPLAIIKNATSNLRRQQLRHSDRDVLLGILDEESDRLNRLVNELLTFASPVVPRGRSIRVCVMISHAIELARKARAQEAERIMFDVDLSGSPESIACDPDLLQQALVNITENALQAMPDGGKFSVRASQTTLRDRPAVALLFSDTGEGMELDVRAKATDPFFTTRPTGTGLGLAIVERIMRAHHGELAIQSVRGQGTTVTLTVPTDRESVLPGLVTDAEFIPSRS